MLKRLKKTTNASDLIWALRVSSMKVPVGLNKRGSKIKFKTYLPSEVMDRHLEILDNTEHSVFFSSNTAIDLKFVDRISRVILFSAEEEWYVICNARIYVDKQGGEFVPQEANAENQVEPWIDEPRTTWIELLDYRQIFDESELENFQLLNSNNCKNFRELVKSNARFTRVYCVQKN